MIHFFGAGRVYAVVAEEALNDVALSELTWLFSGAEYQGAGPLPGYYVGPRRESITPWSTNAVEITQNMGLHGILRIEAFDAVQGPNADFDPMLQALYNGLAQNAFDTDLKPEPIEHITDLQAYNQREGLALSNAEIEYLNGIAKRLGRPLTDSEVFGFSQVNSEHCRHKIFGGTFIIDGRERYDSLFALIKKTTYAAPNQVVSAYEDNVAFLQGPKAVQFAPQAADKPSFFAETDIDTVLSLKAETHNFPTTVEPFNGAATGSGGEIRDRMAGGTGSLPLAGTAVYMTSYPRLDRNPKPCEDGIQPRKWLYQTPAQILIKASNGASDFGNKFGQPLIVGSLLTFELNFNGELYAYDKVIMQAGGVGYARKRDAKKQLPEKDETVVLLGGDNYRIGMGGGAVSSLNTGQCAGAIELNAVQRSNPEMQKRVENAIRGLIEGDDNPIISIHDHGAGGHLNCLSELVGDSGGEVDIDALPIGDKTLSDREIVGNESQERMGLLVRPDDVPTVQRIAERERAPFYVIGKTTGDQRFTFSRHNGEKAIDWQLSDMFGNPPKTVMTDTTRHFDLADPDLASLTLQQVIDRVLALEGVACKDWLTNKVDRSVTGRVARQQCVGPLQLPLSDYGLVALDYDAHAGIATSLGHAPGATLVNAEKGVQLAATRALTGLALAPLAHGRRGISLSANWMWPCRQPGQDARLYLAVDKLRDFASALDINIPTGKDSLSMTQQYPDGSTVLSPGTVIISAMSETKDVRNSIGPVLSDEPDTLLFSINFSDSDSQTAPLGGSALAQALGASGAEVPSCSPSYVKEVFDYTRKVFDLGIVLAAHDVAYGGLFVTLLEMLIASNKWGLDLEDNLKFYNDDPRLALFQERPAIVVELRESNLDRFLEAMGYGCVRTRCIGRKIQQPVIRLLDENKQPLEIDIATQRDKWFAPSAALDNLQTANGLATVRQNNFHKQPLLFNFPQWWNGIEPEARADRKPTGIVAAIIREKGINGDREMAYTLYKAGFDVKDVHMTDLAAGRETLDQVSMIVFCGGFSNSDVLGSAKGWAGAFKYNDNARQALQRFYDRPDTLSLGVCNGCQLVIELGLLHPDQPQRQPHMRHNRSHKFESAFLSVTIPSNQSVMFGDLSGAQLGVWVAHGEGRFELPQSPDNYNIVAKYAYHEYPGNPNGSDDDVAAIASDDGRHIAIMPHPERAIFPWQCGFYPAGHGNDDATPWLHAFVNARKWILQHSK